MFIAHLSVLDRADPMRAEVASDMAVTDPKASDYSIWLEASQTTCLPFARIASPFHAGEGMHVAYASAHPICSISDEFACASHFVFPVFCVAHTLLRAGMRAKM